MIGTFWSLVPAIVAIALALITKEVYSSLFIGIILGAVFFVCPGFTVSGFVDHTLNDGFVASLSDSYNVGILIFLVILGTVVALMNKAGGSAAFGNWAKKHIKTRMGAQLCSIFLGVLIFIDDYFNCLTVGSVMRPVTDKFKVSRTKLAYLIDATAAPVCIIAPVSSWAAAVAGFVQGEENGFQLFCKAIPYNFYALFTIFFMIAIVIGGIEYGPMAKAELDIEDLSDELQEKNENSKGTVFDLVFPIITLIVLCTVGMLYSGGYFTKDGDTFLKFIDAFGNSDASVGLVIGSLASLIIIVIVYVCRRVLKFTDCMSCLPDGFKAMVPAILILTLAWTLKNMTDALGAKTFVAELVNQSAAGFKNFLPAIIFIIAGFLAFATGTSWGTFGILIPICIAVFPETADPLRVISISACMAGAVCGDHISPISDTTIMASAGAQCEHVKHVSTQLPYALTVAAISFVCYILAGFMKNWIITNVIGVVLIVAFVLIMKKMQKKSAVVDKA